jgi:predicted XRE-type DNA-binding protein
MAESASEKCTLYVYTTILTIFNYYDETLSTGRPLCPLRCTRLGYTYSSMEFGKLTAEFMTKFKVWVSRQNESQAEIARRLGISRQALTDQLALRKRPNSETLLRMQQMMKKRPHKKRTADCRIAEPPPWHERLFMI